jgi:hypothetical protein
VVPIHNATQARTDGRKPLQGSMSIPVHGDCSYSMTDHRAQSSVRHQHFLRYPRVDTTVKYVSGGDARGEKLPFLTYGPTIVGLAFTESFGLNVNVSSFRLNHRPSLLNLIRRSISRKKETIPQDSGL